LKLLINELNHRVKNTLATVQSMAGLTLRTSPTLEEAAARFDSRLIALAGAHDVLTRENWEGADLQEIVGKAIAPYRSKEHDRFFVEGPDIALTPRFALALAMALHELSTNAAKYGALSGANGRVDIVWAVAGQKGARELCLDWRERNGPKVARPTRRGFGSRLIEQSIAQDLGGKVNLEFAADGVVCNIRAPLEPKAAIPDLEGHDARTPAHR
jgi:two-component sensor histidine kinase